jgi:hypothetical protein
MAVKTTGGQTKPQIEAQVEQEQVLLSWIAKSRPFRKTDMQSRQVLIVLGVLIGMVLVFAQEWMLLAVLISGAFYYYAANSVAPGEMEFQITNYGLRAFGRLFRWWEFSQWWWAEKWTTKLIGLQLQTGLTGRIFIPVEKGKEEDVEKILNKYVYFEKPKELVMDKMGRWVAEKFPLENKI